FLWMVSTSLKPNDQIFAFPPEWIPRVWMWVDYANAMQAAPFALYFRNTGIYAGGVLVFQLTLCSMAGYAFARLPFPGRQAIFVAILATMMVPSQMLLIPLFVLLKHVPLAGGNDLLGAGGNGWLDSFAGLIVPQAVTAFGIFLMRQFFQTLPAELGDAARIDGASEAQIFWRIMLPLTKPALATLGIITFQAAWNDFLWPLVVTDTEATRTLQLGLQVFQDLNSTDWALLMAATTVTSLPIVVVFLVGQRYLVRGIALTGLKG
ncbi:MAG TPA: carbohydrate ABC transporter permease, partial [Chloroflexota bacterium]|nr:carbohydrate ABC transporter permease [Chloroflexota bacterium]